MEKHVKTRIIRIAVVAAIALSISIALVIYKDKTPPSPAKAQSASPMAGVAIGGPYTLSDHTGATRTDADFKDSYKLIYFGFTYCPAICPTELSKISAAMTMLPPELADKIQPLFITIDPERDTVPVMRDYVSLFHDRLIGLTGTPAQIETVKKAYRVYAAKAQDDTMSDYTMDHSSYIYFMSPDDTLLTMYRTKDSAPYMAEDIQNLAAAHR